MKARIYINKHIVRKNKMNGTDEPSISVRTYKGVEKAREVEITLGVLKQDPQNAHCSGATVWIEANRNDIKIIR